jgi:hypothetical protein
MKAEVGLEMNAHQRDKQVKRAPGGFDDDDEDGMDVEEQKQGDNRNI